MMEQRVLDEKQTEKLAGKIAAKVKGGRTIGLVGGLGAGKTTFVRYFAEGLGVKNRVSSPSYALCFEYQTPQGLLIEHWDLYRVTEVPQELLEPVSPDVIRLIEWADKFPSILSDLDAVLSFSLSEQDPEGPRTLGFVGQLLEEGLE
ncbi:MAG: tRNA (adenosine(37)-N6)-threonylcarbamoyltransferase complex ATPase subunit type 1 TsaE [Deltaproteobacteria bacterium]|nr:tRNA (adenosine(37)-N6)-threonylcarbamoyltransferase complex ATPase subunit type 1 TsaE [Deltaproteobacteria bacterium]